jgi:hypothetical protein
MSLAPAKRNESAPRIRESLGQKVQRWVAGMADFRCSSQTVASAAVPGHYQSMAETFQQSPGGNSDTGQSLSPMRRFSEVKVWDIAPSSGVVIHGGGGRQSASHS